MLQIGSEIPEIVISRITRRDEIVVTPKLDESMSCGPLQLDAGAQRRSGPPLSNRYRKTPGSPLSLALTPSLSLLLPPSLPPSLSHTHTDH